MPHAGYFHAFSGCTMETNRSDRLGQAKFHEDCADHRGSEGVRDAGRFIAFPPDPCWTTRMTGPCPGASSRSPASLIRTTILK